jgi:putative SOS response-associated peptidase YedK
VGALVQERPLNGYIRAMCGRFTRQYTWQQLHALYRLTVPAAIPNFQPDYNVCPTDPADAVVPRR